MKTFFEKFSYFFQSAVVTLIAALFVTSVVYAATTIGANINTGGNLDVDGSATSTSLYLSNDLTIGGNASTSGDLVVNGLTIDLVTSTATTTAGIFARNNNPTSTVSIGDINRRSAGCLEMAKEGAYYRCYLNDAENGLECVSGRCN